MIVGIQVVTLSTYSFFTACIVGRQYIEDPNYHHADVYFPLWTVLQFLFYMGLLKVAEQMINPYGKLDLTLLIDLRIIYSKLKRYMDFITN